MADRKAGPTCASKGGCRSGSYKAGPLAPEDLEKAAEQGMIEYDIDLIAGSKFASSPEGEKIVQLLRRFSDKKLIAYGNTGTARGEFYGTGITIKKDYSGNVGNTILELVHEAAHATWRASHPLNGKGEPLEHAVSNELFAQEQELIIYRWLKDRQGFSDYLMDLRLERQARGTLKLTIAEREMDQRHAK